MPLRRHGETYLPDLPRPPVSACPQRVSAAAIATLVVVLVWILLDNSGTRLVAPAGHDAGITVPAMVPGDGAPVDRLHPPTARKKPRQFVLASASRFHWTAPAATHSAMAWIAPSLDNTARSAFELPAPPAGHLPRASVAAGQLRLHSSQAPPSA